MAGKWFYVASAALAGILLSLEWHLLTFLFSCLIIVRVMKEKNKHLLILLFTVLLLFFSTGMKSEKDKHSAFSAGIIHEYITFQAFPEIDGNRLKAVVTASNNEKLLLTHIIQNEEDKHLLERKLESGASCHITGELIKPQKNSNENGFNYQQYLFRHNIHWLLETDKISLENCSFSALHMINKLRNIRMKGIKKVEENFPIALIPYANALIFGERSNFTDETYRAYQQIGVVHLLAISGLHIGLLVSVLYFGLLRVGFTKENVFWILFCLLPIYAVLSGGNPPVMRAVLMALLLLAGQKWRLPFTTLDALSISFIAFLFYDPYLVYHVGFQLTYCVSFALIVSSRRILQKTATYIKKMINISIVSMLASFPVLSFHFYEFSIISIIANIVYIPFYTIIVLPFMFFLFFLQFIQTSLFHLLSEWGAKLLLYSEQFAAFASSFNFSMIVTGKPGIIMMVFMIVGVIMYLLFSEQGKSMLYSGVPLVLIFFIFFLVNQYSAKGEVIFIDVGQGDSILINLPYNRGTYLIDTGGSIQFPVPDWEKRSNSFQVGEDILLPLLKSKRINRIDKLILTHSDMDHMGAAHELLGKVMIKEIIITPRSWEKTIMADLIVQAQSLGIPVNEEKVGSGWHNKSGKFQFIYPFNDDYEGNNDSLVLFGEFGGLTWVFTGDLEKEGEEEIIKKYGNLQTDVLKIGHHGSRSSTTSAFLEKVQPKYSIISAGRNNRYGHPHPEVLAVLNEFNTAIFRTDEHGAIHYEFTKKGGTFKTQWQYDKAMK